MEDLGEYDVICGWSLIEEVLDADLNIMFDGAGNGGGGVQSPKLTLLRDYAGQIANDYRS